MIRLKQWRYALVAGLAAGVVALLPAGGVQAAVPALTAYGSVPVAASTHMPITPARWPQLLQKVPPAYPLDLYNKGIEGSVVLSIRIAEDGPSSDVTVAQSSGYTEMDDAAVNAAYHYLWKAGRDKDGRILPMTGNVTVDFKL